MKKYLRSILICPKHGKVNNAFEIGFQDFCERCLSEFLISNGVQLVKEEKTPICYKIKGEN